MGLLTGSHGVETLLKSTFPTPWTECSKLTELVEHYGATPKSTAILLDGNVLVRQIPQSVDNFFKYTDVFMGFLTRALDAADLVIVVWDEPEFLTKAKAEEQNKRDAQTKKAQIVCSEDITPLLGPTNDDYVTSALHDHNPQHVVAHRAARARLYDEVVKTSLTQLDASGTLRQKDILFDGIDPRGADRPIGTPREAEMVGSNSWLETLMSRKVPIGEGDLKLPDLASQIQYLRDTDKAFQSIELIVMQTIDTDSIAIELMAAAARRDQLIQLPILKPMKVVLALRKKRTEKRAREEGLEIGIDCTATYFSLCEMDKLFESLVVHFKPPSGYERHLVALLVAGLALCKSDFVYFNGLRPDAILAAMKMALDSKVDGFVANLLKPMTHTWNLDPTDNLDVITQARDEMVSSIDALVGYATEALLAIPRMKQASNRVKNTAELDRVMLLRRASWVICYWSGACELTQLVEFGFPPPTQSADLDVPLPPALPHAPPSAPPPQP